MDRRQGRAPEDAMVQEMLGASTAAAADRAGARGRLMEASRERLLRILATKIRTAFIAPLAQIEEQFGVLWGRKRRPEDMTEAERTWWDRYQGARERILTGGNNQIRATQAEVCLYEVLWRGYHSRLPVGPGPRTE